jgi:multimeric flavodoxin WrbA
MKILLLNGSPRPKGNTKTALNQLIKGMQSSVADADIEQVEIAKLKLSGCTNCEACKDNGGECVTPDDSADIMQKIYDADVLIIGTPVYYWGITAQMKMVVDKFYSKNDQFSQQKKRLGLVTIGEAGLEDPQYELISRQFECICNYLGWDMLFAKSVCAYAAGDLAKASNVLQEIYDLSVKVK